MKTENQTLDLENMIDEDLTDFGEAADYVDPPDGRYSFMVNKGEITKFEDDDGNVIQNIRLTYTIQETTELTKSNEPPVADGSYVTQKWPGTLEGVKRFKLQARKILGVENLDGSTLGQIFEALTDCTFDGVVTHRKWKFAGKEGISVNIRVI
jgi:hypothetical protein